MGSSLPCRPPQLWFTGPDDAENPSSSGTGRSKVRHSPSVVCVSEQENPAAHLSHYSTSASGSGTAAQASSAHLSLFDSMFNDRLTKDLQMRAGVSSAKVGFHCVCTASVLMCII